MFKATIEEPKDFKTAINAISALIDRALIVVDEDGIKLKAMDPAHVTQVSFEMAEGAFDEYDCIGPIKLGVNLEKLNTVLKRAGADDTIILEHDSENEVLKIKFKGISGYKRRFIFPLEDVSEEEFNAPDLAFPAVVECSTEAVGEAVKDAAIVGDNLAIGVDDAYLRFSAEDTVYGSAVLEIPKDECISFTTGGSAVVSKFDLSYLKDAMKASGIAATVKIHLGKDMPVRVVFVSVGKLMYLSYLQASRIDRED